MEKRLISKVFEHELLYAVDSAHYRDRHMRAMAWADIGKDLGLPAAQCKDMWRKLRNCYLNAIARRQNKNIPKWKHEDEMSFLLPFIDLRSNSENDVEIHTLSSGLASTTYSDGMGDNSGLSEREDSSEMILPEPSAIVPKTEPEDLLSEAGPRRRLNNVPRSYRTMDHPAYDETEMFFLSMCETVKRLQPVDQAKIKMELCKLVYQAEIRQLEAQYEETL